MENSQVSDLNLDTHEYSRLRERNSSNSFSWISRSEAESYSMPSNSACTLYIIRQSKLTFILV